MYGGMGEESKPNLKQKQNKKLFLREGVGGGVEEAWVIKFFYKESKSKKI